MTLEILNYKSFVDTSAFGSLHSNSSKFAIAIKLTATTQMSFPTTSAYEQILQIERTAPSPVGQFVFKPTESTGEAILEIRRRSGLKWKELSDLFDVSRRTVHHWANGKPASVSHEQKIRRMLDAIRFLDKGAQSETRALLLSVDYLSGNSTFDLLKNEQFDEATKLIESIQFPESARQPQFPTDWDPRKPPPPILLLEADHERPDILGKAGLAIPIQIDQ